MSPETASGPAGHLLRGCPRHPALCVRARGYDACEDLLSEILLLRPSMDLFHRFAVPLPRARGCDACEDFQSSIVLVRPSKDLFHRLRGPPSPCAGKAARIAALVVLPKGRSPSGGMYSAWRRTAIARGNTCRGRGCISGALAPGVKKGFFPCQLPGERTSFKQRAFRTFVRLHSKGKIPLASRLRGALRSRPRLPHLAVR